MTLSPSQVPGVNHVVSLTVSGTPTSGDVLGHARTGNSLAWTANPTTGVVSGTIDIGTPTPVFPDNTFQSNIPSSSINVVLGQIVQVCYSNLLEWSGSNNPQLLVSYVNYNGASPFSFQQSYFNVATSATDATTFASSTGNIFIFFTPATETITLTLSTSSFNRWNLYAFTKCLSSNFNISFVNI